MLEGVVASYQITVNTVFTFLFLIFPL